MSQVYTKLILDNNSIQFNIVSYIQTIGTDIWTKTVSMWATLFLAYLKKNLYEIIDKK